MKVAIDARWIFPEISGIGNYTRQLLRQFARLNHDIDLLVIFNDREVMRRTIEETELSNAKNIETRCIPWGVFSLQSQIRLPLWLNHQKIDLFHSPNYMIPLMTFTGNYGRNIKCITTIHDVIPLIFPDHAPKSKKSRLFPLFRGLMREVGRRSDAIITVSDASRHDILQQLNIPTAKADKVHTIYNGVSERFRPTTKPATEDKSICSMLYVGRSDPYKNLAALIHTLANLKRNFARPVELVIAGSPDPRYPEANQLAAELGVTDLVRWTGYLSDAELVETYRSADLLIHPSRYEGFGLQLIEAMACGTPVVSSNAGSLAEVAGDAALLVDPDDIDGFTAAVTRVLTQPEIAATMREKGFRQAAKFTWEASARKTLDLYRQTISPEKRGLFVI